MKKGMKMITLMLLTSALLFPGAVAYAEPNYAYERITAENFDADRYASDNPDLLAAFGRNRNLLFQHYRNNGKQEGRLAHALPYKPSRLAVFELKRDESYYFDADRYASDYPDLLAAFGRNKKALWNHYKNYGFYEGRKAYGTSDSVEAKRKVFDVAESITNDSMTEREKIKAVHDWIINHTSYDRENYYSNSIPEDSYNITGVMLKGVAVCSGYAKTFDYFMYVLGIEHEHVTGLVDSPKGGRGGHAWNRVLLDNTWYYIDCTWDDEPLWGGGERLRYKYYLISYDEMAKDHEGKEFYKTY